MSTVSAVELRHALGHFPTGVTVVTTTGGDGHPVGTTVSAVTSLSAEPALLLVCLARSSATLQAIRERGTLAVNVLAAGQDVVSSTFARAGVAASWEGVTHRRSQLGNPVLDGVLAALDCTVEQLVAGGDHEIVIGRVVTVSTAEQPVAPLIHWRGAYASLQEAA